MKRIVTSHSLFHLVMGQMPLTFSVNVIPDMSGRRWKTYVKMMRANQPLVKPSKMPLRIPAQQLTPLISPVTALPDIPGTMPPINAQVVKPMKHASGIVTALALCLVIA